MIAALVPVKQLSAGKSRLAPNLGRADAARLVLAMLEDVVASLRAVPALDPVAVVSPDEALAKRARALGARALLRPDPGLNASLDGAVGDLSECLARGLLVVLGDVAGAEAGDVETIVAALDELGGRGVVLVPSSDGGTSALLRAPHDLIPCAFGADSAKAHRALAERAGAPLRELTLPSLALDLDRPDDLDAFLAAPGRGGARTSALLRELGWEPRR